MITLQLRRAAALRVLEAYEISQWRACRLVGVEPKTVRREREPEPDNLHIRKRMREIAERCRRFGYRRIGLMLEREGIHMNHKKLRRIYREEGLSWLACQARTRRLSTQSLYKYVRGPKGSDHADLRL